MNRSSEYDVVIIGAGMAGLAAGIRLAHFGKRVCIFERHNAPGGLNGFYSLAGRKYDVGLHAVTNFVRPEVKGTPLGKLLRQLRIDRAEFALCEQRCSAIRFGGESAVELCFSNDPSLLESSVAERFPSQVDGFRRLVSKVRQHDDVALDSGFQSARAVVREFIGDPLLEDMIFCPVMYYGSPTAEDMDFSQFVIMFKALFLEGFARPREGVRVILRVLLEKYRLAGGERRMKCGVRRILRRGDRAVGVELDSGEEIAATHVLSSIGAEETARLIAPVSSTEPLAAASLRSSPSSNRRLSFAETITILNHQPVDLGWGDDTIIFFNDGKHFDYRRPSSPVDVRSGVICLPNNFNYGGGQLPEGILRVTCLANPAFWIGRPEAEYRAAKREWYAAMQSSALRYLPTLAEGLEKETRETDMFTPWTIQRYTGHLEGAIYGSPEKVRDGRTALGNVYLCGTDQGFLGIIGAMLSGISMANYHILARS